MTFFCNSFRNSFRKEEGKEKENVELWDKKRLEWWWKWFFRVEGRVFLEWWKCGIKNGGECVLFIFRVSSFSSLFRVYF